MSNPTRTYLLQSATIVHIMYISQYDKQTNRHRR